MLVRKLQQGELHLSALKLLGPKLTDDNHQSLLSAASGKSKSQLQALLAERFPVADVASVVRKLPRPAQRPVAEPLSLLPLPSLRLAADAVALAPAPAQRPVARPQPRPELAPLSPQRFKVQFTASRSLYDKLQTARRLTRHRHPDGDLAAVIEQALQLLIEQQMKRQFAHTCRPRSGTTAAKPGSRHIPAQVRRAVAQRDGMRCSFVGPAAQRCQARERLQFHHEQAFALGGEASVDNIRLLCQPHNQLMAERDFGPLFMPRARAARQRPDDDRQS
jgi:5-methylcytosine-specific restriction endonuclease McrA